MKVAPDSREEATVMKILLLGESNVGKTSLVTRYSQDRFDAQSNLLTVGIDIRKVSKQVEGRHVLLECTMGISQYGIRLGRRSIRPFQPSISEVYRVYFLCTTLLMQRVFCIFVIGSIRPPKIPIGPRLVCPWLVTK
jgi:GTPase SAR1 family protein